MSSDEEVKVNPVSHKKLLSEINDIVKFQHIKKPKRSEPAIKNDEFHLVKTKEINENENEKKINKKAVSVKSIAEIVKSKVEKKLSNQFQETFKKSKVLNKPLERIHAEKIQRSIAYDNTKTKLSRWDAVVTKNKITEQLQFPLGQDKTHIRNKVESGYSQFRFKTPMMKEIEEIHNECFPKTAENDDEEISTELLTLEEMKERRKELARLKLRESHQMAKKRLQGKIKSKKYHRLKKKEELKKKLKEFEELKATNPEAALKELEKIEKQRVQERANLRHKNTGTWAKNMKVRAQYDTTAKQELEAQLALGRELTQKNQKEDSSDSDEEEIPANGNQKNNPWLSQNADEIDPLDEVFSGYKKYWEEKNASQKALKKLKMMSKKEPSEDEGAESDNDSDELDNSNSNNGNNWVEEDIESSEIDDDDPSNFINDIFDEAEDKITNKMESKLKELKPKLLESIGNSKSKKDNKKKKRKSSTKDSKYLEFSKNVQLGDIDEALMEGNDSDKEEKEIIRPSKRLKNEIQELKEEKKAFMRGEKTTDEIDPQSFLNVKSKHLLTAIPKTQEFDDIDEDEFENIQSANKLSLAEAFENDDIINDFVEEVDKEQKQVDSIDILPGWGSWGGEGVKNFKKIKSNKPEIKKKDRIIVNTTPNEKLRKHLVSKVPFPFTTIKDYEASMRVPIGKDFVPATAHQQLTAPSIITKAGTIIEPMNEEALVENESSKNKKKLIKRKKNFKK